MNDYLGDVMVKTVYYSDQTNDIYDTYSDALDAENYNIIDFNDATEVGLIGKFDKIRQDYIRERDALREKYQPMLSEVLEKIEKIRS